MDAPEVRAPRLPPPWLKHAFWRAHRAAYRLSGERFLWTPASSKRGWGALHLTTVGRKSGQERSVILGYLEDGSDLVTLAMNGWDEGDPAWWLNLQAHPEARVQLTDGIHEVVAHAATGAEQERLWARWRAIDKNLDDYARRRPAGTAVVVLTPRQAPR